MSNPLAKYAPALLSLALVVIGYLANAADLNQTTILQLVIVGVGAVGTYFVPLVPGAWAGALKTGVAVVIAVASGLTPLLTGHSYTVQSISLVILAGLTALATEVGVGVRVTASAPAPTTVNYLAASAGE